MARVAELQRKYPGIHRDIIVKWDVLTNGIRDTNDLDTVSSWRPASQGTYGSYDEEFTLQRLKTETPWRVKDDAVLLPDRLWMKTGLGFPLFRKQRSPYLIREIGAGKVAIFEGNEMIEADLYPPPRKQRQQPELVTGQGTPVRDLVQIRRNCYWIVPVRYCEYFNKGEECKFCNFNPSQEDARAIGINRPVSINPEETAEAFRLCGSEVRLLEGVLEGGGFKKTETEASVNLRFVEQLNSALPYKTDMKLAAEALPRRELERLKDAGLSAILFQMELFDEHLFSLMVPGKAKHMKREEWLEAFQNAVEVFGVGNVGAKFVGGLTLQGPHGYKTWQEARDSHMQGDQWMIRHGVFPAMAPLRWAPGSPFSRDPTNRDRFAPTEYYLDLMQAHHAAMKEYDLYDKLNKLLYCGLCCSASLYVGEMGIMEIAGDVGTWMSAVVPYEYNWLAQLIDSTKSSGTKLGQESASATRS
ncbi:MAG: hypothetical protein Q7O66_00900 [Dehalococcoidia bacterium]|nr:hypothetical protein [Dehalococcoidia bacterium]